MSSAMFAQREWLQGLFDAMCGSFAVLANAPA